MPPNSWRRCKWGTTASPVSRGSLFYPESKRLMRSTALFKKTSKRKTRPRNYRSLAATVYQSTLDKWRFGKLGPASPVRKIDPVTGKVMATIKPD